MINKTISHKYHKIGHKKSSNKNDSIKSYNLSIDDHIFSLFTSISCCKFGSLESFKIKEQFQNIIIGSKLVGYQASIPRMERLFDRSYRGLSYRFRSAKPHCLLACSPETRLQSMFRLDKSTFLSRTYFHTIIQCISFPLRKIRMSQHRVFFHCANYQKKHLCLDRCTSLSLVSCLLSIVHNIRFCLHKSNVQFHLFC